MLLSLQVFLRTICRDQQPQLVLKVVLWGTPGPFVLRCGDRMFSLRLVFLWWLTVSLCSQSGKLVTKMFQKIQQLIDDKDALVFVLIDEVKIWFVAWTRDRKELNSTLPNYFNEHINMHECICFKMYIEGYQSPAVIESAFVANRWRVWQLRGAPARQEQNPQTLSEWSTLSSPSLTRSKG